MSLFIQLEPRAPLGGAEKKKRKMDVSAADAADAAATAVNVATGVASAAATATSIAAVGLCMIAPVVAPLSLAVSRSIAAGAAGLG